MSLLSMMVPIVFMATVAALVVGDAPAAAADHGRPEGPRKVVIGTSIFPKMFSEYPGLEQRLAELGELIDEMAAEAERRYGEAGLDLAVLTEGAVTRIPKVAAASKSQDLDGPIRDFFSAKAREHQTYIVVPMHLADDRERGIYSNAAVLFGRDGEVVGVYRKYFPVTALDETEPERGITPGNEFPVFECDFGRLGIQICWDMTYEDGWKALAERGAEIVAWPSMSPQTVLPSSRAVTHGYYLVSATPRNNAAIFDPAGQIAAQITPPQRVLVEQVDLDYAIVHWQPLLRDGASFREAYGDRAGYRYSPREDTGLFWSNDPEMPVGRMLQELGLESFEGHAARSRRIRDRAADAAGSGVSSAPAPAGR